MPTRLSASLAFAAAVATSLLVTPAAVAQGATVIVSPDWLAANLDDPKLVVIHAAAQKRDYDAGHVRGARWLPWTAYTVSMPGGLSVQLPTMAQMDSALEAIGVRDDSRIVIVGGPIQTSGRLYFTLDYFGLGARTSLLDGGIGAWRDAGRATETTESAAPASGNVTLTPNPSKLADAAWVHANGSVPGVSLLDARLPQFYTGESAGSQPRAGRIPGAKSIPYSATVDASNFSLDPIALHRLFDAAGAERGNKVVTYCHIGMQATALYVAARILGYDAAVYDGSFEEWSRKPELPVVGPIKP
ncbi:MAG: rhodanese-like domain-containing protein [Gemmatimonadetes bacterium]|nr:rhodanese-like domain-containing protein [Gemmatimonadota bacterium]